MIKQKGSCFPSTLNSNFEGSKVKKLRSIPPKIVNLLKLYEGEVPPNVTRKWIKYNTPNNLVDDACTPYGFQL